METSLFNRAQLTLLAVATLGLMVLAGLNLRQENQFQQPDDGVWWREAAGGLEAVKVLPNSPGQRAGIQVHDLLTGAQVLPDSPAQHTEMPTEDLLGGVKPQQEKPSGQGGIQGKGIPPVVNYIPTAQLADLERVLDRAGIYGKANYAITRQGEALDTPVVVIPEPVDRNLFQWQRVIGLIYLAIGIYVLFRRWTAPRATHFYLFCLVSLRCMRSSTPACLSIRAGRAAWTGLFSGRMYWLNRYSRLCFCISLLVFPRSGSGTCAAAGCCLWSMRRGLDYSAAGSGVSEQGSRPACCCTGLTVLDPLRSRILRSAALLFVRSYRQANTPLQRQQLKWLTRGALLAVVPFTLYAIFFFSTSAFPACSPTWLVCRWSFCRSPSVGPLSATG